MKVNKFLSILVLMILFALSTLGAKESIKEIRISGELAKEEVDALSSIFDRYIGEDLSNDLIASAESEVSGAFGWVESLSILDSTKDEDGYSLEVGVEKYPESELISSVSVSGDIGSFEESYLEEYLSSFYGRHYDENTSSEALSGVKEIFGNDASLSIEGEDWTDDGVALFLSACIPDAKISSFSFTGDELDEGQMLSLEEVTGKYVGYALDDEDLVDAADEISSALPFVSSISVAGVALEDGNADVTLFIEKSAEETASVRSGSENTNMDGGTAPDTLWYEGLPIGGFDISGVLDDGIYQEELSSFLGSPFDSETESAIASYLDSLESVDFYVMGVSGSGDALTVSLEIYETPRLGSIVFSGNDNIPSSDLAAASGYQVGEYLKLPRLDEAEGMVRSFYAQNGYPDAEVSAVSTYDSKTNTEEITFEINEGERDASFSSGASSDPSRPWYEGMEMADFEYTGLLNVKQAQVDRLMRSFRGDVLDNETFQRMFDTLYAQPWLEFVTADAIRRESDGALIVRFNFVEYPMVSEIIIEGNDAFSDRTLIGEQSYTVGSFVGANNIPQAALSIKSYYLSRGYKDADVTGSSTFDEATNTEKITFTVTEGRQYKVRDILYEGVSAFSSRDLNKIITSKRKGFFTPGNFVEANISQDVSALETHYLNQGFMDARVVSVDTPDVTTAEDKTGFVNIVFTIEEGERWYFGPITFSGNERFDDEAISSLIDIEEGEVHDQSKLTSLFQAISGLYYDNGYINASIIPQPDFDRERNLVSYHISIDEGAQSVIESIRIRGLSKTKPYVFERELTIHEGDIFDRSQVIRSQQNIYNTGLIKNIRLELLPGETENGVIIDLEVEEGNQMELQFGATFGGTVDGFPISGFLQWSDKNLLGTGRNLAISTTLSPDTQSVAISLSNGWVGDKRWSNGISFSFSHQLLDDELQKAEGSAFYDGRDEGKETFPLGYNSAEEWYGSDRIYPDNYYLMDYDYFRFSIGYDTGYTFNFLPGNLTLGAGISIGLNRAYYDESRYTPYNDLVVKYHDAWQFSNKLSFRVVWDARDYVTNTTKGYLLSVNYTYAGGVLFGLSNYNRLSVGAQGFVPLFSYLDEDERNRSLVLSFTTNASFMFDQYWNRDGHWGRYSARQGATEYEMLYIDGMNIGRGFDTITDLSFLWHNQIDLSFPVVLDLLNVEAFVSMTGATSTLEDLSSFYNIRWYMAMGAGFKLTIPGFPLGLYLVKNATILDGSFQWEDGYIFGMKLVLAISTSLM